MYDLQGMCGFCVEKQLFFLGPRLDSVSKELRKIYKKIQRSYLRMRMPLLYLPLGTSPFPYHRSWVVNLVR